MSQSEREGLKACPFCGKSAENVHFTDECGCEISGAGVCCSNSADDCPLADINITKKRWNAIPSAPAPELVEALAKVEKLEALAREVCWFDWSDNDDDAVAAIDALRRALTPEK